MAIFICWLNPIDLGKLRQVSLELETVCCYLPTTEREKARKSTNIAHMAYNAVVYKKVKKWKIISKEMCSRYDCETPRIRTSGRKTFPDFR